MGLSLIIWTLGGLLSLCGMKLHEQLCVIIISHIPADKFWKYCYHILLIWVRRSPYSYSLSWRIMSFKHWFVHNLNTSVHSNVFKVKFILSLYTTICWFKIAVAQELCALVSLELFVQRRGENTSTSRWLMGEWHLLPTFGFCLSSTPWVGANIQVILFS